MSGTAAGIVLRAERGRSLWLAFAGGAHAPSLLGGTAPRFTLEKCRGHHHGRQETLSLRVPGSPRPAAPSRPQEPLSLPSSPAIAAAPALHQRAARG